MEALAPEGSEVSNALAEAERVQVKKLDYFDKSTYDAIKAKLQQMGRRRRNAVLGERLNIEASRLNRENVTKVDAKQEGFALGPKGRFHKAKRLKGKHPMSYSLSDAYIQPKKSRGMKM